MTLSWIVYLCPSDAQALSHSHLPTQSFFDGAERVLRRIFWQHEHCGGAVNHSSTDAGTVVADPRARLGPVFHPMVVLPDEVGCLQFDESYEGTDRMTCEERQARFAFCDMVLEVFRQPALSRGTELRIILDGIRFP